jgi:hypothetical protein
MRRRTTRATAALLVSAIGLAACSSGGHDKPGAAAVSSGAPRAGTDAVRTVATVATVTGNLGPARREALAQAVAGVVDGWLDGAYLGDFPRSEYGAAFAGFTPGAAAKARRDLALMTNSAISSRIDEAAATRRSVSLDVLSVRQRPVGVTATVDLAFTTAGALTGQQQVTGTLDLTPVGDGWKVFGFDITRTPAQPGTAAPSGAGETPGSGS